MTTAAKTSYGAELWMAPVGQSVVKVAELLTVSPPQAKRSTIDATTHDSGGVMEFIPEGIYDPGEISGQVNYIAGSDGDAAFVTAVTSGTLQDMRIVLKSAADTVDFTFRAMITSYGPDAQPVNGKQTASFAAKVSGAVTQAAS